MSVTEVTTESWFSRLGSSIKSVLFGLLLFALSFVVLFWNEGRAVQTAQSLTEGAGAVVALAFDKADAGNDGKLVHMSGLATTDEVLKDTDFGVSANAIKLLRKVEMFQWRENKRTEEEKQLGGSVKKITTYTYETVWDDHRIDSSGFKEDGHANPPMRYTSTAFTAGRVTFGAFTLNPGQIDMMGNGEDLKVTTAPSRGEGAQVVSGALFLGDSPGSPRVGDLRVSFRLVKPMVVSLIAQQAGATFAPYQTKAGDKLSLLVAGQQPAAAMFKQAQEDNVTMTWILRLVGFLMMLIGLVMIFKPISVFGDVVPIVGSALGAGLFVFSFMLSVALSLGTIAVAWLAYRPVLGVLLMAGAVGALVLLVMRSRKRKAPMPAP